MRALATVGMPLLAAAARFLTDERSIVSFVKLGMVLLVRRCARQRPNCFHLINGKDQTFGN